VDREKGARGGKQKGGTSKGSSKASRKTKTCNIFAEQNRGQKGKKQKQLVHFFRR
jgi:hypothetical protein